MNEVTMFIGKLLGPYMLLFGFAMLVRGDAFKKLMKSKMDPMMMVVGSAISFVIGMLMLMAHNLWGTPTEIIITIVGWAALLKGITLAFAFDSMDDMGKMMIKWLTPLSVLWVLLGAYISYQVYLVG